MKAVFADTLYWIAILNPRDSWREAAIQARKRLMRARLVTTDGVFAEVLASLARSPRLRELAASSIRIALDAPDTLVIPQTRDLFLDGLALYEARPDKHYSLTDCISMSVMRSSGIADVLTNDEHFAQEGFNVLIRPARNP